MVYELYLKVVTKATSTVITYLLLFCKRKKQVKKKKKAIPPMGCPLAAHAEFQLLVESFQVF